MEQLRYVIDGSQWPADAEQLWSTFPLTIGAYFILAHLNMNNTDAMEHRPLFFCYTPTYFA